MLFGSEADPEYAGDLVQGNPGEKLHKIRFGHQGIPMPSSRTNGWSTQEVVDVLGYAQSLAE